MPHPCNSRRLVLTLDRATARVLAISSACRGLGERKSSACTWATVRLIPQRVPISPQCRMKRCSTGVSSIGIVRYFCQYRKYRNERAEVKQDPACHRLPLRKTLLPGGDSGLLQTEGLQGRISGFRPPDAYFFFALSDPFSFATIRSSVTLNTPGTLFARVVASCLSMGL